MNLSITVDAKLLTTVLNRIGKLTMTYRRHECAWHDDETHVRNRFEARTDPFGQPWAPWKPSMLKSYPDATTLAPADEAALLDVFVDVLSKIIHKENKVSPSSFISKCSPDQQARLDALSRRYR